MATATGLIVAVMALVVHAYYSQRLDHVITDMEELANILLSTLSRKNSTGEKIMRLRSMRNENHPQLMIIPMIDIIFFLLVFFMMSTLYMVEQHTVPINLLPRRC